MSDTVYIFTLFLAALAAYAGVSVAITARTVARAENDETTKSFLVIYAALAAIVAFCGFGWLAAAAVAHV